MFEYADRSTWCARSAFSLIELLLVIAIIGVMSGLVIASFSNATQDSRRVLALQQQATLQSALNAWIAHQSSVAGAGSVAGARALYDGAGSGAAKLALIQNYLDPSTYAQFSAHGTVANGLASDVMTRTGQYITFSSWPAGGYPQVELNP